MTKIKMYNSKIQVAGTGKLRVMTFYIFFFIFFINKKFKSIYMKQGGATPTNLQCHVAYISETGTCV